jgi:hypothetical protein
MDTPFERMDLEVKKEWLMHPATEALLATLAGEAKRVTTAIVDGTLSGGAVDQVAYSRLGGQLAALQFVLRIAEVA